VGYTGSKEVGILADKDLMFYGNELFEYRLLVCSGVGRPMK
jgi:hypothetical protein